VGTPFSGVGRTLLASSLVPGPETTLPYMIFVNRSRRGPDPYVRAKTALFVVGAVAGLVGMRLENAWVISGAIAVLVVAVALRLKTSIRSKE